MRLNRFLLAALLPVLLIALGTLGYHLIEGWPMFDAFYMTVITLTTVGFRDAFARYMNCHVSARRSPSSWRWVAFSLCSIPPAA